MKILTDKEYRRRMREARERERMNIEIERGMDRLSTRIFDLADELRKLEHQVEYLKDRIEPPTIQQG